MYLKILVVKLMYYLFFSVIFLFALIIFLEILDFPFYEEYFGEFFRNIFNKLD